MENTTEIKPGCPQCGKPPRGCIKQGPAYRKKSKLVKVQMYQCTECGYKGRGNMFRMTEEMGIEKEKSTDVKVEQLVKPNDPN